MLTYTVLLILLLVPFHVLLVRSQTVTIDDSEAYGSLRSCAADSFGNNGYYVGRQLSCNWPAENACFCRADLQQGAIAFVSSRVASRCNGNDLDVSSAVSVYTSYCANVNGAAAPATTTGASTVTVTVTVTPEAVATATVTKSATVTVTVQSGVATTPAPSPMFLLPAFLLLCPLMFGRS